MRHNLKHAMSSKAFLKLTIFIFNKYKVQIGEISPNLHVFIIVLMKEQSLKMQIHVMMLLIISSYKYFLGIFVICTPTKRKVEYQLTIHTRTKSVFMNTMIKRMVTLACSLNTLTNVTFNTLYRMYRPSHNS